MEQKSTEGAEMETVEDRIIAGRDTRREENFAAIQKASPEVEYILGSDPKEIRARHLNEATDLIEEAYDKLRAAVDTLGICDIRAQERYAALIREMGKTVKDFSEKL